MSDLGLRYGEEFRPVRELSAVHGRSAGRVVLSEALSPRAGEYALHPVLFDGALQVFSAGAATVEGRQARMKLPVGFPPHSFSRLTGPLQSGVVQRCASLAMTSSKATSLYIMSRGNLACWWMGSAPSAFPARVARLRPAAHAI